jgi:hypothetical protein
LAGVATYGSQYLLGADTALPVGAVAGFVVGIVCAHYARSWVMVAGILGNVIAVASLCLVSVAGSLATGGFSGNLINLRRLLGEPGVGSMIKASGNPIDWSGVLGGLSMLLVIFVAPGLFGSLWIWEGRRSEL